MAATGTPTPNIGLRRPQGTDPASVDDINYNSNLLDTKLGAVGNTSVQDQIDSLNSNFNNNTFTAPPMASDYTLLSGGYIKIGKIVYVHMVIKATGGAYTIATNLPKPKIANANSGRGAYIPNNINKNITVNSNTALYIGESLPANTEFIVTGTYICV